MPSTQIHMIFNGNWEDFQNGVLGQLDIFIPWIITFWSYTPNPDYDMHHFKINS